MSDPPVSDYSFRAPEIATLWRYIASTIDRFVALARELDPEALWWRPPVPGTNSIGALLRHTMGNAAENLVEVLRGLPVSRDRDSEFVNHDRSAVELAAGWFVLRKRLIASPTELPPETVRQIRHHPRRGSVSGLDVLIIVARHAAEHFGQAELTRDWRKATTAASGSGP